MECAVRQANRWFLLGQMLRRARQFAANRIDQRKLLFKDVRRHPTASEKDCYANIAIQVHQLHGRCEGEIDELSNALRSEAMQLVRNQMHGIHQHI